MIVSKSIACVLFVLYEMSYFTSNAQIGKRTETPLEIEVAVVADYSSFNKWYELLDPTLSHTRRVDIAKQNLTTWLGAMIHSANFVYKRLEAHGLFISIKLVDLIIMTTVEDSPWTETTKFKVNSTYMVDADLVHPLFKVKSLELQKTIPHDHALLFTRYTLIRGPNGTTLYAGNAYIAAECKARSQSIVEDSEDMYTAQTIAHELGHSLGCQHDGMNNNCTVGAGYLMEANYTANYKNEWIFSSCSIDYIRNFVDKISRLHTNCLAKVNDNHPKPGLALASQQWVGQLYTFDEQCVIAKGRGSHMCRGVYQGNFTALCPKMYCYLPKEDLCSYIEAGDGTPCASGAWCVSNNCVKDQRAPAVFDDKCPFGDQEGVVHTNLTCKQVAVQRPNDCLQQYIKHKCCTSCKRANSTAVSVDTQCKEALGSDSYMCRSTSSYATSTYSILCSKLYCFNTSTTDTCSRVTAYDKTPCGNKKWCIDEQCVPDSNAPAVSDDCPMGDRENDPSVSSSNLTCAEIRQHENNLACYRYSTAKACCKTCSDIQRNITGCEYGDQNKDCFTLIASQRDSHHCYIQNNADICCETCTNFTDPSNIGCEYGDKNKECANLIPSRSESYHCYDRNVAKMCCGSCKQYNASNTDGQCPFGEHDGVAHKQLTCQQIAVQRPNDCLRQDIKQKCCTSCKHANTTAVSVDIQCKEALGSDSYMCRSSPPYATSTYSLLCSKLYCFNTSTSDSCSAITAYDKTPCGNKKWCMDGQCVPDSNAPAVSDDCPMGDQENDSSVSYSNLTCAEIKQHENNMACYRHYTAKACCKTCSDIRRNIKGCEYGDQNKDCFTLITSKHNSYHCYTQKNADICCETCSKYKDPSNIGCEYGDKNKGCANLIPSPSEIYNCYGKNVAKVCCGSCQLYNTSNTDDKCPFGEQEGVVHKQLTCKQIAVQRPNDCLRQDIKQKCCTSCKHANTTVVSVDTQCKEALGSDSYMCRSVSSYATSTYSLLCSKLYCFNTSTSDSCSAVTAYDKTPCGNKKWCIDGQCVADSNAPAVPDECPMGDQENDLSVSYRNLTCSDIRQHENNLACYSHYTAKACCKTCSDIRRNIQGCEYGDKNKDCFTLIASNHDSFHCYTQKNADICCETCNKYNDPSNIGCEYGDHSKDCASLITSRADALNCYAGHNADICCASCGSYYNPSHKGCEYGDKLHGCSSDKCPTLTAESRKSCCNSCRSSVIVG